MPAATSKPDATGILISRKAKSGSTSSINSAASFPLTADDLQNSSKILSKEEILKQLQEKRVSCKDVTFKIFGLSLTSLNIVISVIITIVLTKIYLSYEKNK